MENLTVLTINTDNSEEASLIIEILAEIRRAKDKHPVWPEDHVSRAAIVSEEAGEVIREANHLREGCGNVNNLRMELIQTAGVCIRMINIMDAEKIIVRDSLPESKDSRGLCLGALLPDVNNIRFHNRHF